MFLLFMSFLYDLKIGSKLHFNSKPFLSRCHGTFVYIKISSLKHTVKYPIKMF